MFRQNTMIAAYNILQSYIKNFKPLGSFHKFLSFVSVFFTTFAVGFKMFAVVSFWLLVGRFYRLSHT